MPSRYRFNPSQITDYSRIEREPYTGQQYLVVQIDLTLPKRPLGPNKDRDYGHVHLPMLGEYIDDPPTPEWLADRLNEYVTRFGLVNAILGMIVNEFGLDLSAAALDRQHERFETVEVRSDDLFDLMYAVGVITDDHIREHLRGWFRRDRSRRIKDALQDGRYLRRRLYRAMQEAAINNLAAHVPLEVVGRSLLMAEAMEWLGLHEEARLWRGHVAKKVEEERAALSPSKPR
jgi:hypothetical protein